MHREGGVPKWDHQGWVPSEGRAKEGLAVPRPEFKGEVRLRLDHAETRGPTEASSVA